MKGEELVEKVDHEGGIYSGYLLNGRRHGPGTWVNEDMTRRYQGIWSNDHFCVGKGRLEFNDGTVQIGRFVNGKYKPAVSV